ncbi:MAG: thiamine pyrophosphate-dependent dehydrogenase E1 component subunit alpha [Salinirussus sp.]
MTIPKSTKLQTDGGTTELTDADRREMLYTMLLIRRLEEAWGEAWHDEQIAGIVPALSTGQEAVATGAVAALADGDVQTTTHRGMAPQIATGLDPDRILAELYMRRDGYNKGKSYHVTDADRGLIGMGGIIAAQVPVAAGMALAADYREEERVGLTYFGDGASNEGVVTETLALAAMWDLPLVMLCVNNGYNISQPADEAIPGSSVAARAGAYNVPGEIVDGNDPISVYKVVSDAVARARGGHGPTLIEARTRRLDGHLTHDPQRYRSEGELADAWECEPIVRFRARLEADGVLTDGEFGEIEERVEEEIAQAIAFAQDSPYPDPEEAFEDLWA